MKFLFSPFTHNTKPSLTNGNTPTNLTPIIPIKTSPKSSDSPTKQSTKLALIDRLKSSLPEKTTAKSDSMTPSLVVKDSEPKPKDKNNSIDSPKSQDSKNSEPKITSPKSRKLSLKPSLKPSINAIDKPSDNPSNKQSLISSLIANSANKAKTEDKPSEKFSEKSKDKSSIKPVDKASPKSSAPSSISKQQLEILARMVSPDLLMSQESNPDGSFLPGSPSYSRGPTPTNALFTAKRSLSPKPSMSKPENNSTANGPRIAPSPKPTETTNNLISKSSQKTGSKLISNQKPATATNQSLSVLPSTSWLPLDDDAEDDETAALMMDVEESTQPEESTLEEEDSINRPKILQETTIPRDKNAVVDGKSNKHDAKSDRADPKLTKMFDHSPSSPNKLKSTEITKPDSKAGNSLPKSPSISSSHTAQSVTKLDLTRTVASDAFKKILETSLQNTQLQSDKITEFLNKSKANAQSQLNNKNNKSERSSRKSSRAATPTGDLDLVLKNLVSGKLSPRGGSSTGGSNTPSVVGTEEMAKKQAIPTSKQFQFGAPPKVSSVVEGEEKPKATRGKLVNTPLYGLA